MAIDSIDDILYSIGLCHHSVREDKKRSAINSPKIILFVVISTMIMQTISLFTDNEFTHLLLNELSLGMGIAFYASCLIIILSLMTIFSQSVYYWNYKRGIEPTFVRVFQVMSGSITPSSVGLTNERQVRQLFSIGKWIKPLLTNNKILPHLMVFGYTYLAYLHIDESISRFILIILFPYHFIFFSIWVYYCQNLVTIQLLLFILICNYFKIKLIELNKRVKKVKNINRNRIMNILHSYDKLYREINEYNTTYWSKFLFNIWFFFGVEIVFLIYIVFFAKISLIIQILATYYVIFFATLYLFIMSITSSLNSEANKSHKIFNTFYVKYCKLMPRRKLFNYLKVFINIFG